MLQWVRSVLYTVLLFLGTGFFGVIVLLSALLPLSIEQRYVIPRAWGLSLTWLAKVVCGLGYVIEGQENLPSRPFISLWKHSSVWGTLAQMFDVPPASLTVSPALVSFTPMGASFRMRDAAKVPFENVNCSTFPTVSTPSGDPPRVSVMVKVPAWVIV